MKKKEYKISRREFVKLSGGAVLGFATFGFDGNANAAPSPPDTTPAGMSRVVAARGDNLNIMTNEALSGIGGIEGVVKPGETVLIKPNMLMLPWADKVGRVFHNGECVKAEVVIAVAEACLAAGASKVIIGDGSQKAYFDWGRANYLDNSTNIQKEAIRLNAKYKGRVYPACLDSYPTFPNPKLVDIHSGVQAGGKVARFLLILSG